MSWELKPAREAFPSFVTEWDRLNLALYNAHPLFDSRFVGPLLEYFGGGSEQLCIHRTAGTVDGALILRPTSMGRWALFLPSQAQAGPVLLADARLLETLMPALPGFAWTIELFALDPQYSPDWSHLHLPRTVLRHALTIAVELGGGDFAAYWSSRPKNLVKNLRRYQHREEEQYGESSLVTIDEPSEITAAITRYGALESASWKGREGTAIGADNVQGRFYEKTMRDFAATGQARVLELHVGGKLAASRLLIRHAQMWVILKTTYEESLAAIAPGRLLLHETLKQAFQELRTGTVEFYTSATIDQAQWATSLRYIRHHQLYRSQLHASGYLLAKMLRSLIFDRTVEDGMKTVQKYVPVCIKRYTSRQEFTPETTRLFEEFARQNIEFSLGWFDNLQRSVYGNDPGIHYYVAELAGTPTVALPMRLVKDGLIRRSEALGNFYTSLYSPIFSPCATAVDLVPILEAASRDHHRAHVMRFAPLDADSPTFEALLTALRSSGWIPFRFFCFGNWYLTVDKPWSEYLKEREGKLRSTINRMGKKFAAEGGTLETIIDPAMAEVAIQAFNDVYALSWKKPEPYPEFIPGLIRWLAPKGQLRLGIARLNGRPVAAQIWIVANGKASIFKLAYDEAHAGYSPGTLLTAHLMKHAIDRDTVAEIDYLIGDDEHKKSWMNHRRERWGIVAYNPKTVMGFALLTREIIGRMVRKAIQMARPEHKTQAQAIHWKIIPIDLFDDHAARWDALQQTCANLPFLESSFLKPLLAEFGTGREVLALGNEQGKLCAAAILTKTRPGIWQTFQPSQLPLGAWVSDAHADLATLGKSLIQSLPGLNLSLTQIDPLFQPRPADGHCLRTMDYINTAWVDIDQAFDTYWEARGKNLKTNLRKQRAKLETENVAPRLECVTTPAAVAQSIADYGALEIAGWKGKDGTAIHPGNAQGRFYQKMLENFCAQGRGRIYRYRFNDKVVAMDLCIETGDKIVILKTAYDESYKAVSPSSLMRQDEFRELFTEGRLKRIEFYGKVMEWHTRWTEYSRTIYHATVYRWPFLAKLHAWRLKRG
ncbi:MAG: GNAT family N-acetyltransferase [Sideroxyarcus sp.]|nr:GNAT family N-acetyltransferase [Sideroxyarcus sp.]